MVLTSSLARAAAPASAAATAYQHGLEALKKGDLPTARTAFEKAVRLSPTDAASQASLGWVMAQQGESDAATTHLKTAIKLRLAFASARITLAGILAKEGKSAEAEQQLRAAVKSDPNNAEAHRMLGRTLSHQNLEEATLELRRAVELAPERPELYDVADEKAWNRVFGGPIPVTVGYVLKETIEKSPDLVQGYVNANYRAQQWIRRAKDDEIVDLLWKPFMDSFKREVVLESVRYYKTIFDWDFAIDEKDYDRGMKVWVPLAVDKPIPYARAVDMSFVKKAQAKFKS
jgi:tetratricopeptide (TPR) repeat protein